MNNLRYALRLLGKSPAFTLIAVVTLALGIGVNSGIFAIVDAVMLRPLPYPAPEHLVSLWETLTGDPPATWNTRNSGPNPRVRMPVSVANLVDYSNETHSFAGVAGYEQAAVNLTEDGPPERIAGERVTADYFSVLGVAPSQGRAFLPDEQRPGNDHVVILSYQLWQRRLGLDPNWTTISLMLDGEKYRVVGIMPQSFQSPGQFATTNQLSFFVPESNPAAIATDRGTHQMSAIARLKPAARSAQAQAELDAISTRLAQQNPGTNRNLKTAMAPLGSDVVRNARTSLLVMLAAVGLVLLIACANLANLLLARAIGRQREITIRFALGASRSRIVGELLTQSLVLAALGSAAGLALGIETRTLLVKLAPAGIPRLASAGVDSRVVLFTLIVSLGTGILFGLFPALQVSKARPAESLKSTERGVAGSGVMRWRSALMAAEVAVSMILLVGAGLLVRSFLTLNGIQLGFETEHVLAMSINLPAARYASVDRKFAFFNDLSSRVGNLPGVASAAFANHMPMRGGWDGSFLLDNDVPAEADLQTVSPGFFETLQIPLLRGRLLTPADRDGSQPVAVVSTQFGRSLLNNQNPVGRRFRFSATNSWVTIVGVVGDIRRNGKDADISPEVYLPAAQGSLWPVRLTDFAFRTAGDPKRLVAAVQQQVWALDKDQPVTNVRTLDEVVSRAAAQRRFQTLLLLLFAGLALALALVGVYGVISYSVSQRTGEIGLRIALGAGTGDILRLVILRAMVVVGAGILAGAAGAYGLSRYLQTLLFEIKPGDPATYGSLALLLSIVAFTACYVPARRATRVDPMVALRYE
jgi:putative ABC transport system permease protein